MGEKTLVESKISDAVALVKQLDSDGDSPSLAVWYYYDDAAAWRLLIAGAAFDPNKQSEGYRKIVKAMDKLDASSLTIDEIQIISDEAALAKAIRFLIRTDANGIVHAHFSNNMINGVFLEEMIVLRSAQPPAKKEER